MSVERLHVSKRFCEVAIAGNFVHLAGQLADDLSLDIKGQTEQTLANIDKYLSEAGTHKANILSVTIYLKDIARDYAGLNEAWDNWVAEGHAPARACVEANMYTPNVLVEMVVVAVK